MKMEQAELDRLLRAADIVEIEMNHGRYLTCLDSLDWQGIYDLMAKDHPELSYEMVEDGAYRGPEAVGNYMMGLISSHSNNTKKMKGWIGLQYLYTPRIVLNERGDRARAQWNQMSPHSMLVTPYPGNKFETTAYWFIGKYDNEYIKINGEWKLLKTHIIAFSRTPYDEGWVRQPDCRRIYHPGVAQPQEKPRIYSYHSDAIYTKDHQYNWGPHLPKDGLPDDEMGFGWE